MISPNDLSYFIEIAKTENLSRASERVGISQPSLTLAIRRIEDTLGADIFIRSKKGVTLTKAGLKLLKHSKNLFQYWDQIKSEALASEHEVSGQISIGCHPSVGLYTLDKFLPKLLHHFPELGISLHHDLSRNIVEQIISLKIDLGLVINPTRHPDLILKKVLEDTVTFWTNGENTDTLICDPDLLQTQDLLKKCKKRGLEFSRFISCRSLENIANLSAAGAGVGIIPQRIIMKLGHKNLRELKGSPIFKDELFIAYRIENKNVRAIQEIVKEMFKNIK